MEKISLRLRDRKVLAEHTIGMDFQKPSGFTFAAGQYVVLHLPNLHDPKGSSRFFSLSSAPHEAHISIALRTGDSAFKQVLESMPLDTVIDAEPAAGKLVLPAHDSKPIVCLAGGIGVTPFRSIIRHAAKNDFQSPAFLFYSSRTEKDTPFLEEFSLLAKQYPQFAFIPTFTRSEPESHPRGEAGRIDATMIKKYISDYDAHYYIAGSHEFIDGMRKALAELSVSKNAIRTEVFCGYCPHHACCCDHVK